MEIVTSRAKKAKIDAERERVLKALEELKGVDNTESAHIDADRLLCEFLRALDEDAIAEAYEVIGKWYS